MTGNPAMFDGGVSMTTHAAIKLHFPTCKAVCIRSTGTPANTYHVHTTTFCFTAPYGVTLSIHSS